MRLWSIHPKYLDSKGLVALWRESLLAKKVLEGATKGYKNHPQLLRFKLSDYPKIIINNYLKSIWEESVKRGYKFDRSKFDTSYKIFKLQVTKGQVEYEFNHLQEKLKIRDYNMFILNSKEGEIKLNPNFFKVSGGVESWEIIKQRSQ